MALSSTLISKPRNRGSFTLSGRRYAPFNKDGMLSKINNRKDGSRGSFAIMSSSGGKPFVAKNRP